MVHDGDADRTPPAVRVACLGDVMLDVIVQAPQGLVADDDTPATITFAAGGQAANVAAWVETPGGRARVFGPHSDHGRAGLVTDALEGRGVEVVGPHVGHPGTVVSLVTRSLASDPGDASWLDHVAPGPWVHDVDWLMVSGYALLRSNRPEVLKHGPGGASFVIDGVSDDRPSLAGHVVDTTGAGDSLTAGYLVGGADLAMSTAAACVAQVGAQPEALA